MKRYRMSHRSTGMGYESNLVESADGNLVDISEVEKRQAIIDKIDKIAKAASGEDQVADNIYNSEPIEQLGRCITCGCWERLTDPKDINPQGNYAGECSRWKIHLHNTDYENPPVAKDGVKVVFCGCHELDIYVGESFGCVHWIKAVS